MGGRFLWWLVRLEPIKFFGFPIDMPVLLFTLARQRQLILHAAASLEYVRVIGR